jgi:hypothetical protein
MIPVEVSRMCNLSARFIVIARSLFVMTVAGALVLSGAGRARADEPKGAPDLAALKDAVTTADKKGENVEAIRDALSAFEKALAKGAAKPGEAPPELTALREAVEMAARKGENVGTISKELGAIEKALTGREYERPKPPPPPQPEPVPPMRRPGGFAGGGRVVIGGGAGVGGGFNATSITISNGNFIIKARRGEVAYTLTGSTFGVEATKITIQDGEKKIETEDVKKVPEEYRPAVEQLLKMVVVK